MGSAFEGPGLLLRSEIDFVTICLLRVVDNLALHLSSGAETNVTNARRAHGVSHSATSCVPVAVQTHRILQEMSDRRMD